MISYGGYPLPVITDPSLVARISQLIEIEKFRALQAPVWSGIDPSWQSPALYSRTVPLGTLHWPRGTAWAMGHFVCDEGTLNKIRATAYDGGGAALTLKLDDEKNVPLETAMYMLPPRPLFQWDELDKPIGDDNLYLLTLVDDRYFWWHKAAEIVVTAGTTTWASLISSIGTGLGVTISTDTIDAAYLKPPADLTARYDYLPPLLDAVAASLGKRVVRSLDGTVAMQDATGGRSAANALWGTWRNKGFVGGDFRFSVDATTDDIPTLVPGTVRIVFPKRLTTAGEVSGVKTYDKTLASLGLDAYSGVTAKPGYKLFRSTAVAWDTSGTIDNATELQALTDKIAADYYLWQVYSDNCRLFAGIVPWQGDGTVDYVEWTWGMTTKVVREALNDLTQSIFHEGTDESGTICHTKIGDYDAADIADYDGGQIQVLGHDTSGCLKWYDTSEC